MNVEGRFGGMNLMFILMVISFAALVVSTAVYFTRPGPVKPEPGLCDYPSPRPILSALPAHVGTQVIEKRSTCVTGDLPITVTAYRAFVNDDDPKMRVPSLPLTGENQSRNPGAIAIEFPVPLPLDVTPGSWHLEGADVYKGSLRLWSSDSFTVVP